MTLGRLEKAPRSRTLASQTAAWLIGDLVLADSARRLDWLSCTWLDRRHAGSGNGKEAEQKKQKMSGDGDREMRRVLVGEAKHRKREDFPGWRLKVR
jgi:hypothetical protein